MVLLLFVSFSKGASWAKYALCKRCANERNGNLFPHCRVPPALCKVSQNIRKRMQNRTNVAASKGSLKYVKIEIWEQNKRNRKQGALKAQLQSAQGSALGHGIRPTLSAPCKGS
jgi:hypothetical protein